MSEAPLTNYKTQKNAKFLINFIKNFGLRNIYFFKKWMTLRGTKDLGRYNTITYETESRQWENERELSEPRIQSQIKKFNSSSTAAWLSYGGKNRADSISKSNQQTKCSSTKFPSQILNGRHQFQ